MQIQSPTDASQRILEIRERPNTAIITTERRSREDDQQQKWRNSLIESLRRQVQALKRQVSQPPSSPESSAAFRQPPETPEGIDQEPPAIGSGGTPAAANQGETGFWQRDLLLNNPGGIRSRLQQFGITVDLQDVNQAIANLAGGIRRGIRYSGDATLAITIDLDKAVGWTGGTFFARMNWLRGRSATHDLVGSLQQVSYTETGRSGLRDIWLDQSLLDNMVSLRAGQERVDEEFLHTQFGEVLVNSTFGWPGLTTANLAFGTPMEFMSVPVARVAVQPSGNFRVLGAVFNGTTRDLPGTLAIGEAQYITTHLLGTGLPGTYRVGVIYQSGSFTDQFFPDWVHHNTSGAYIGMDQMIWRKPDTEDQGVGVFARAMIADRHSLIDLYLDSGVNWKGAIAGRPDDIFGFGVAYLRASKEARNRAAALFAAEELVRPLPSYQIILEATYLMQLTGWLQLQPDIQYIIQPDARIPIPEQPGPLKNSLVVGLRVTVSY